MKKDTSIVEERDDTNDEEKSFLLLDEKECLQVQMYIIGEFILEYVPPCKTSVYICAYFKCNTRVLVFLIKNSFTGNNFKLKEN